MLVLGSQVPGMRAQTFHASYGKFDRLNSEASSDSTCMKRLSAHPLHLIRASKLSSSTRGFSNDSHVPIASFFISEI
jgi:hypothetical protein